MEKQKKKVRKLRLWINYCISLTRGVTERELFSKQWHFFFFSTKRGETDNTRRLDFVCYKHALIRFINRFTWKRIQV